VHEVVSLLLNIQDEGVVVGGDVRIIDKFSLSHGRLIEYGEVATFHGKICNAGALRLVTVSRFGYRRLAIDYAEKHDIPLLTEGDPPRMNVLLDERLQSVALPNATAAGEPFWTRMELHDGNITGSFSSRRHPISREPNILLFYCRFHSLQAMAEAGLDTARWTVRGLPQHVLRASLSQLELLEMRASLQQPHTNHPALSTAD
jgi:hypothetical protein